MLALGEGAEATAVAPTRLCCLARDAAKPKPRASAGRGAGEHRAGRRQRLAYYDGSAGSVSRNDTTVPVRVHRASVSTTAPASRANSRTTEPYAEGSTRATAQDRSVSGFDRDVADQDCVGVGERGDDLDWL